MTVVYTGKSNETFQNGKMYSIQVAKFSGKSDNRFMVYGEAFYKVFESAADVLNVFNPANENAAAYQMLKHFSQKHQAA